jgi:hypothetical protein
MAIGTVIYLGYGRRHSVLARRRAASDGDARMALDIAAP